MVPIFPCPKCPLDFLVERTKLERTFMKKKFTHVCCLHSWGSWTSWWLESQDWYSFQGTLSYIHQSQIFFYSSGHLSSCGCFHSSKAVTCIQQQMTIAVSWPLTLPLLQQASCCLDACAFNFQTWYTTGDVQFEVFNCLFFCCCIQLMCLVKDFIILVIYCHCCLWAVEMKFQYRVPMAALSPICSTSFTWWLKISSLTAYNERRIFSLRLTMKQRLRTCVHKKGTGERQFLIQFN